MGTSVLRQPIRGLLFDMGDVLYDATVWRRWLLQLLTRLGLHTNYRSFYGIWDRDYLREVHRGQRDFREAFESFLLAVGLSPPQIDEVKAACQARRRQLETESRPLPGVRTTIARLYAAGLTLGVLSDSEQDSGGLKQQLERFGLGGMFTAVRSSIDLAQTKPEPACYLRTLKAMNVAGQDAAFVGHDAEELAGAANVGMQTIAFNYDLQARADVYIARFEELLELVAVDKRLVAAG